mmetsp:Transcript_17150/g.42574  ORF Transcript_17150/g.42574 Transcript_17150/m.42574 type:complete len:233 (+) Transcript_17150:2453-3151(+)
MFKLNRGSPCTDRRIASRCRKGCSVSYCCLKLHELFSACSRSSFFSFSPALSQRMQETTLVIPSVSRIFGSKLAEPPANRSGSAACGNRIMYLSLMSVGVRRRCCSCVYAVTIRSSSSGGSSMFCVTVPVFASMSTSLHPASFSSTWNDCFRLRSLSFLCTTSTSSRLAGNTLVCGTFPSRFSSSSFSCSSHSVTCLFCESASLNNVLICTLAGGITPHIRESTLFRLAGTE